MARTMMLARSTWRKGAATLLTAAAVVGLHQVTMLDSQNGGLQSLVSEASVLSVPGAKLAVTATAYCKGEMTTSGVAPQNGVVAADPHVLPVGSVVQVDSSDNRYSGIYTVMDTGRLIQGLELDVYIWNCFEAIKFGRRPANLLVLRLGWNPRATTPTFMDRLFRRGEPEPASPSGAASKSAPAGPAANN
jgi:3D (Asp-Asp-Asp) domain-containing protein